MPRRFSVNVRWWIYQYLCERDGEHCQECLAQPTNPISATQNEPFSAAQNSVSHAFSATQNKRSRRHKIVLEVDHIDGNHRNNDPKNLRLLCKSCNVAESNRRRSSSDLFVCVRKRARAEGNPATRIGKSLVDYTQGSAEMQAANMYEPRFRTWLMATLNRTEHLAKDDVIASGAEIAGCSMATATRYLSKLTSSAGPLVESRDLLGRLVIRLKPEIVATDED